MFAIWNDKWEAYLRALGDDMHDHIWDNRSDVARSYPTERAALDDIQAHFYYTNEVRVVPLPVLDELEAL